MIKKVSYKESSIAYHQYGKGDKIVFCFHGYGLDGSCFEFLEDEIFDTYTLFCIDLPFHGETIWQKDADFHPSDLFGIITLIYPDVDRETISIIGYSLGGRISLSLAEYYPEKIKKLLLIAPDGLQHNYLKEIATRTTIGRKVFLQILKNTQVIFKLGYVLNKLGLLSKSKLKFANAHLDTSKKCEDLYNRWIALQYFYPNLKKLRTNQNTFSIEIEVISGEYDQIIKTKACKKFCNRIDNCRLMIVSLGHQLLSNKVAATIVKMI